MLDPHDLPEPPDLMIPGPGHLHDSELEALGRQIIAHYGPAWVELLDQVQAQLAEIIGVSETPYLIPGSGSTSLDAAVASLFEPGQRVALAHTGFFGNRLLEIATAHRLDIIEVPVEIGSTVDLERLASAAAGADGVLSVHVETSTGVRHPVAEIARIAAEAGAISLIDGIASVGGETMPMEQMGIDALVTGTQKGLEAPAGLGVVALGPRARERLENRSEAPRSWYLDLKTWDRYRREWEGWHPHPVTMPAPLVLSLASSLKRIIDIGLEKVIRDRAELAAYCRAGLERHGLKVVADPAAQANMVVAAYLDDPQLILKELVSRGIQIGGGLAPVTQAIRVGLMGRHATHEMVDRLLDGVSSAIGIER